MKKTIFLLFFAFFLMISCGVKQPKKETLIKIEEKHSIKKGAVSILEKEFIIKNLNTISHKIWLYLPPNYTSSKERFSVIYMHDAQNLFDAKTSYAGEWEVDETLNDIYNKTGKSFIVVGAENGGEKRIEEYTPWTNKKYGGGKGAIYVDFLVNELKPYIDTTYRTKSTSKKTAIIGSSLGGLISFYGGLKYPKVFGKIGALSTSFWFSSEVQKFARENGKQRNSKMYLLAGEKESGPMAVDTENMAALLIELGFPTKKLKTKIVPDGTHSESFWRAEFSETITYLFNL